MTTEHEKPTIYELYFIDQPESLIQAFQDKYADVLDALSVMVKSFDRDEWTVLANRVERLTNKSETPVNLTVVANGFMRGNREDTLLDGNQLAGEIREISPTAQVIVTIANQARGLEDWFAPQTIAEHSLVAEKTTPELARYVENELGIQLSPAAMANSAEEHGATPFLMEPGNYEPPDDMNRQLMRWVLESLLARRPS